MSESTRRYRVRRDRVPRLLFALSARGGAPLRREHAQVQRFARSDRRGGAALTVRSLPSGRTLTAAGQPPVSLHAGGELAAVLGLAGYRLVADEGAEVESYGLGELDVAVEHFERSGWFCEIAGPPRAAEELARALELEPDASEAAADSSAPRAPDGAAGMLSLPTLAAAAATLVIVMVLGMTTTVGLFFVIAIVVGAVRLMRSAGGARVPERPD